jgi:hypothetical protein
MAISRYSKTSTENLDDRDYKQVYKEKFDEHRKKFIAKKATLNLDYPNFNESLSYRYELHVWSMGDHYYKLAERFYGDPSYWWILAWFNKKPTESHIAIGDVIRIPMPLGQVLTDLGF